MNKIKHHNRYLTAVRQSSELFISKKGEIPFTEFVQIIGKVSNASRTYIFKNHRNNKGILLTSQMAEYCNEGIEPEIDNPELQNLSFITLGIRWQNILSKGEIIKGKVSEFPQSEQDILLPQDIKTILIIPIIIDNYFWGFVGFDNCVSYREWEKTEIDFLQLAALNLSSEINRKEASEQIKIENIRYQTTLDAINSVIYVADFETHELLFLNKAGKKSFGNKIGEKCYTVIQKNKDKPCEFCTNNKLLDTNGKPKGPFTWEFQNTITGRWFSCTDQAIEWSNGKLVRIEIATDITEKKEAELSLKKSEKEYRLLFEMLPYGGEVLDPNGFIIECNYSAAQMLGYEKKEITGKHITAFLTDDSINVFKQKFPKLLKSKSQSVEMSMKHKNGKIIHVLRGAKVLTGADGETEKILALNFNITGRIEAENRLKSKNEEYLALNEQYKLLNKELLKTLTRAEKSERQFSALFRQAPISIQIFNKDGLTLNVNKAWEKLWQGSSEPVIGKYNVLKDEYAIQIEWLKHLKIAFKGKAVFLPTIEYDPAKSGHIGRKRTLRSIAFPIKFGKEVEQVVLIHQDISEIKEKERDLIKAKQKAEESDRLKTEFLHNLSHEIRTPMNAIIGFSELLSELDTTELQKKYTTIIKNSSNQLLRIIDDILEISALETKHVKVIESEICLNNTLTELLAVFIEESKNKTNIPIYLKKGLNENKSKIFIDESKLKKIISNLLENSLKFTSTGFIEFGYSINFETKEINMYVKDTGIGIAADKHQIIFERFSQENLNLEKNFGGLGLGLSIVKENTELLGGTISLVSEKGKGTTFFITLPYKIKHLKV